MKKLLISLIALFLLFNVMNQKECREYTDEEFNVMLDEIIDQEFDMDINAVSKKQARKQLILMIKGIVFQLFGPKQKFMNCIDQAKSAVKHFIQAIKFFRRVKGSFHLNLNEDLDIEQFEDYEQDYEEQDYQLEEEQDFDIEEVEEEEDGEDDDTSLGIRDRFRKWKKKIKRKARNAKNKIRNAGKRIKRGARNAGRKIKRGAQKVGRKIKRGSESAAKRIKIASQRAARRVKYGIIAGKEKVSRKMKKLVQKWNKNRSFRNIRKGMLSLFKGGYGVVEAVDACGGARTRKGRKMLELVERYGGGQVKIAIMTYKLIKNRKKIIKEIRAAIKNYQRKRWYLLGQNIGKLLQITVL